MKKSILARIGVVATALTLATTSLMSGTLARFSTSADVSGKVLVAKWDVGVKAGATTGSLSTVESSMEIKLADTINASSSQIETSKIGTRDSGSTKLIAPGTVGEFYVKVEAGNTEVPVLMTMQLKKTAGDLPQNLKIKVVNTDGSGPSGAGSYGEKKGSDLASGDPVTLVGDSTNKAIRFGTESGAVKEKTFKVEWEWPLGDGDGDTNANDTADANADAAFTISVTLNQQANTESDFVEATA